MFKNKLNIIALGLVLGIVATPALTFAVNLPDSPGDGFNCNIIIPEDPKGRDLTPDEIKANNMCISSKLYALYSWVQDIVRILNQSPIIGPTKDKPVPTEPIKGIPTEPIKLGESQVGWEGGEVKIIQDFLKAEGSFTYRQSTGYFGPITRDAVKTFQTKYGLTSTGVVDKPTLEKMQSASSQVAPSQKSQINNLKPCSLCQ